MQKLGIEMLENLDIITLGESLIELSCDESLTYAKSLDKDYGGDNITTAVAALKMGSKVGYISKVGADSFKDFLLDSWQSEGLDVSQVKLIEGVNGVYFIARPQNADKEFACYRKKTAGTKLSIDDISADYIKSASYIYTTGLTQSLSLSAKETVKKAFTIAKENNVQIAYDPNYNKHIWSPEEAKEAFEEVEDLVDILFLNLNNDSAKILEMASIDMIMKHLWDKGISIVVIKTFVEKGYYVGYQGEVTFTKYYTAENILDTTGAGDAFNGGFLHGLASGLTPFEAVKLASVLAGLQAQNIGAIKSIPSKDKVYSLYKGAND